MKLSHIDAEYKLLDITISQHLTINKLSENFQKIHQNKWVINLYHIVPMVTTVKILYKIYYYQTTYMKDSIL